MIAQDESQLPARILVVDEDFSMRTAIANYLADHSFLARAASEWQGLHSPASTDETDLIVLSMGREHVGLDLLSEIRSCSNIPIIVASGCELGGPSSVAVLEGGADDYLTYPIALRELVARIRAILRRENVTQRTESNRIAQSYHFGGWQIDAGIRILKDPDGTPVRLTKCEYALLLAFLESPGQLLTRAQLLDAMRRHDDVYDRCVDVHISRLRRKLEADPSAPRIIQTARGTGYMFDLPVERLQSKRTPLRVQSSDNPQHLDI